MCKIQNTAYHAMLTRLHVGSHRLAIELGRYHKPKPLPVKERLCDLCNVVEDEYHILCIYRAVDNFFRLGVLNVSLSLTIGAHACREGYSSCPVCVCVCVHSFLPSRASRPRNIGTYGFTTTRMVLILAKNVYGYPPGAASSS